jgi:hypothetical protein
MSTKITLDYQVNRLGFWSAMLLIASGVISLFLPLDIPAGSTAEHVDRVAWLSTNRGVFIAGWANQIVAMLCGSGVLFGIAWQISGKNPLRAILAAMVVLVSVVAYIIPKFMAVWTIPQLAEVLSSGVTGAGAELADPLLRILNGGVAFSLYESLENLGFWMWTVFALLVAVPLYGDSVASKIAALTLGYIGISYHVLVGAVLIGIVDLPAIHGYLEVTFNLMVIVIISMIFSFKPAMDTATQTA